MCTPMPTSAGGSLPFHQSLAGRLLSADESAWRIINESVRRAILDSCRLGRPPHRAVADTRDDMPGGRFGTPLRRSRARHPSYSVRYPQPHTMDIAIMFLITYVTKRILFR